jgi:uncharacterized protein
MSQTFADIRLELDEILEEKLRLLSPGFKSYRLLKKSVDARGKSPKWVISVEVFSGEEKPELLRFDVSRVKVPAGFSVIVVGAGPAGLFAALRLSERGIPCRLIEQGSQANERMKSIAGYWRYGKLDPRNNVCFGEGGAGLYSDGKLITRIKSPYIPYVLSRLVQFGAPEEILYLANPHVGSDKIRKVIPPMREHLKALGCEVVFDTKVAGLHFEKNPERIAGVRLTDGSVMKASAVVLATGHSATDILTHVHESGVAIEGKSFAIGLRIEHPQAEIDAIQFGEYAGHPSLGAANYRLTDHDSSTGIGVYSFCMCPGGYVISSGTEADSVVSNGMSNYARNSPFANAAVVVSIDHESWFGKDPFGGLKFRRELELSTKAAVEAAGGTRQFPVQRVVDFLERRKGKALKSSSPSGVVATQLDSLFENSIYERLAKSMQRFNRKMGGFLSPNAQFHGIESRTSCPVRIIRDPKTLQSISHPGLYPAGEGAGYAGGITSAAVDGVRIAEAISEF